MLDAGESYRTVADILGNSEATLRLHYDGRNDTGKAPSHRRSGAGRRLTTSPSPNQRHHRDRDQPRLAAPSAPAHRRSDRHLDANGSRTRDAVSALGRRHYLIRSEERRVGKECVSTVNYRWSPSHLKKHNKNTTRRPQKTPQ